MYLFFMYIVFLYIKYLGVFFYSFRGFVICLFVYKEGRYGGGVRLVLYRFIITVRRGCG